MATISRFEDIRAWQTARVVNARVYRLSRQGEFAKDFGFKDQIRRSAVSVMSNIAEGFESRTVTQFIDYLGRAKASCGELRCQLYIALDIEYIDDPQFGELLALAERCSGEIRRFMTYLEQSYTGGRIRESTITYSAEPRNPWSVDGPEPGN